MLASGCGLPGWALLIGTSLASPAPAPIVVPRDLQPQATSTPTPTIDRRSDPTAYIASVVNGFGSSVSGYIASGVPQFFQDFPTGSAVASSLGVNTQDLAAKPTQVLNLPSYANWTDKGWNVRVHGNVFKQPDISQSKVDSLANKILIGTDISELPPSQQNQARNLTREIFVVQQEDEQVIVDFREDAKVSPDATGGVVAAKGGAQTITLPYNTTSQGDFDTFVVLSNSTGSGDGGGLLAGNATTSIQALNMYVKGTETGNATAYLVPPTGLTVVSDIDDILRITKIYNPKEGLLNSFARPFTPWMNMPEVYANWSSSLTNFHFHYLTTTPEQITRNYMDFIYQTYPLGSFDTRPLNFSDVSATLSIRLFLLKKLFATFPTRKFILVGDTTNSDVMTDYPQLAHDHPDQVQCIFLRNTTATDDTDLFPYNTKGFRGLRQSTYMFFVTPDDLKGVDVAGGRCWNDKVVQNVTFAWQGKGLDNAATTGLVARGMLVGWALFWGVALVWAL